MGYAISNLQGVRSSSERIAVIERIATTVNSNAEINMLNNLYDRICTKRYRQGGRAVGGLLITVAAIPGPHSPFIAAGAVLTGIIIAVSRLPGLIKKIKTNRHLGEESAERDYLAGSITQGLLGTINLQMYISSLSSLKFDGHLGKSVGHHRRRCPTIESVTKIKLSLPTHYWLEFHCLGLRGKLTDEYIEFICTALQGAGRHSTNDTKAIKVAIYNAFEEHWIELYQDTRNVVNAKLTT
ncbi:hypothetical protein [Zooshikella sp. RANM57]|uniref:hypothetical protein n=1 Tax=Zooshikella sp. RANM57 TaxID=3425863 RepID=UPI003D6E3E83